MINSKLMIATVAGAVVYFLLGWLVYGILLMDFFTNNTIFYEGLNKEMPDLLILFISNLFTAFLVAFICQHWANKTTLMDGLQVGVFLFFLMGTALDLMFYSTMNMHTPLALVVDIAVYTVMGGIIGAVVGWVLGTGKKAEA